MSSTNTNQRRSSRLRSIIIFVIVTAVGAAIQLLIALAYQTFQSQVESLLGPSVYIYAFVGFIAFIIMLAVYYFDVISKEMAKSQSKIESEFEESKKRIEQKVDESLGLIAKNVGDAQSEIKKIVQESLDAIKSQNNRLLATMGSSEYLDDPEIYSTKFPYEGNVYQGLIRIIKKARSEIFFLTLASVGDENFLGKKHSSMRDIRASYFESIEEVILNHARQQQGFTYRRVLQVPDMNIIESATVLRKFMGDRLYQHCHTMLEVYKDSVHFRHPGSGNSNPIDIQFMAIKTARLTGFIVVDKRTVAIITSGVSEKNEPYHAGALIVEGNPNHPVVKDFNQRAQRITRIARNIPDDLFIIPPTQN